MRGLAIGVAVLVILLLAGLLLGPSFIDANRYKGELADWFRVHAGIALSLEGPVDLRLLPSPRLIARDLDVMGLPDLPGARMRVRSLEAAVDPWPLLSGRIEVRSATLVDPALTWDATAAAAKPRPAAEGNLSIDRMEIQNGSFTYREGQHLELVEHINGTLRRDALQGTYRAEGDLVTHGAALRFETGAGPFDGSTMPLHLVLSARPSARLLFDGAASVDGATLKGKLTVSGDDLTAIASLLGGPSLPAPLGQRFSLAGDIAVAGGGIVLENLAVELGDAKGRGSLRIDPGAPSKVAATLVVPHVDFDHWKNSGTVPPAARAGQDTLGVAVGSGATISLTPTQPPLSGSSFALPKDIDVTLDLSVGDAVWRDRLIRDGRLQARLNDGAVAVTRVAASLPGGTDVVIGGMLKADNAHPRFAGTVEANTDNLRGALDWLGYPVEAVPVGRLGRASFSLQLDASPDRVELRDIDGSLDATHVTAAATIAPGDRLGIGARVRVDRLNLDAYLPQASASDGGASGGSKPAFLGAVDLNLDASVDALTWRGQPLQAGHLSGSLQGGNLKLQDLSFADLGGGRARVEGTMEGLDASDPSSELALDLDGAALGRVLRLAVPDARLPMEGWGGLTFTGAIAGPLSALVLDGDAELSGGKVHLSGKGTVGAFELSGDAKLRGVQLRDVLAALGTTAPVDARFDLDAALETHGAGPADFLKNLSGRGYLEGQGGRLNGLDLQAVSDRYKQSSQPSDLPAFFRDTSGTSALTAFSGTVALAEGVLRTDDLAVKLPGADAHAALSVGLPAGPLQGRVEITLVGPADPPQVVVSLDGSPGAPRGTLYVNTPQEGSSTDRLRDLLKTPAGQP